jgi:hypothetical protein
MLSHEGGAFSDFPDAASGDFFDLECDDISAAASPASALTSFDFSRMDRRLRMTHSRVGAW